MSDESLIVELRPTMPEDVLRAWATAAKRALEIAEVDRDQLTKTIGRVRTALSGHPSCDMHKDNDPVTCGWKRAVVDVRAVLDAVPKPVTSERLIERS